jgi:serine/threonine protein kinase/Flp pilus assembly protein TadD
MTPEARSEAPRPDPESRATAGGVGGPADGLTRLLEELARTPEVKLAEVWQHRLAPGEVVGRFELIREVGRGGFGVVYEAKDRDLGRRVAFKALRPGRALDEKQVEGLRREAEAAAQLNHPNVVTIHDFGSCPSGPYLIMELLRGESLSQRLDDGPLSVGEAVHIAREVAQALVHAHAAGVVHRDLKPANVFLCERGAVKVLDFGLAHLFGVVGTRGGTPGYMAPEQCRGAAEDERTDLFGLGVLLYRMLTGRLPFEVKDGRSAVLDEGPSPEPRGDDIPDRLSHLVGRLLAKDPAARPGSALEVADDLAAVERALDPATLALRRRRWLGLALAVLLAGGGGTAAGLWMRALNVRALEHMTVAVADFANETGDPQLEGLSALLITSLEQSHRLSVLTRSRMRDELRKLGRGEVDRIDESLAREVGRATKTRALLLASMRRFGDSYAVELRALDPRNDRYLFAISEQVSRKDDVPALIDRVSERARRALRERDDDVRDSRVEMGEAVTKNLDAYQHYFRGVECMERPRENLEWYGCSDFFRAAVAADPNFALAHYQLAYLGSTINVSGSAKVERAFIDAELAAALRDEAQLPARERSLVLALKAHLSGDDAGALLRYDDLIRRYPDDKHALFLAGNLLYDRSDYAGAVPYLQKAADLDPFYENAVRSLVHALGKLQRKDELRALLDRWSRLSQNPALRAAAVRGAVWLGDLDLALAEARKNAAAATDPSPLLDLAVVQFSRGEFTASEQTLRRAIEAFPGHPRLRLLLTAPLGAQGRQRDALAQLSAWLTAVSPQVAPWEARSTRARLLVQSQSAPSVWAALQPIGVSDAEVAATFAADLALLGDVRHASELKDHLRPHTPHRELAEAVLSWRAGDTASALARLKALDALEPSSDWGPPPSYVLAEIASAAGEDTAVLEAARRFRAIWAHLGGTGGWTVPRMMFLEARALARLGRPDEARLAIERLLIETTQADADASLAREARALRASMANTK